MFVLGGTHFHFFISSQVCRLHANGAMFASVESVSTCNVFYVLKVNLAVITQNFPGVGNELIDMLLEALWRAQRSGFLISSLSPRVLCNFSFNI